MPEEWIRFKEGSTETGTVKVRIEPAQVSARVEPVGSLLDFHLEWEWGREYWGAKQLHWEPITFSAELHWTADGRLVATSLQSSAVDGKLPQNLVFPLTLTQVEELETLRAGSDFSCRLQIIAQMQLVASVNLTRPNQGSPISRVVMGVYPLQANISLIIPRSMWEQNIQPHLGLDGLSSLTITFLPGTEKIFAAPLYELQRAERTLRTASTEEQFESVVMQCRNAVDSLLSQFHLQLPNRADGKADASFGSRADTFTAQTLKGVLSGSQADAVRDILKSLWEPYSGATKPGPAHHSRAFATFAFHQAASVVKLVSEVLGSKQRN